MLATGTGVEAGGNPRPARTGAPLPIGVRILSEYLQESRLRLGTREKKTGRSGLEVAKRDPKTWY